MNHVTGLKERPRSLLIPFVQVLQPFAPHIAEELWEALGMKSNLSTVPWPKFDPEFAKADLITVAIQVLGKTRTTLDVHLEVTQAEIEALAKENPGVANQLTGKTIVKTNYVPKRILIFVEK